MSRVNFGFVLSRSILLIYAILFLYGIAMGISSGYFSALMNMSFADYAHAWANAY